MAYFWEQYVPNPDERADWRCAPFRAENHMGLPPALVISAGIDPLVDEGRAYAEKLMSSGVQVEYKLFPRMTHAFFQAPGLLDDARIASNAAGAALRTAFGKR